MAGHRSPQDGGCAVSTYSTARLTISSFWIRSGARARRASSPPFVTCGAARRDHSPPYLPAPGFSAAADFNIEPLLTFSGEVVELGRTCIDRDYRSCATACQLWHGNAAYLHAYNIGLMFGTAGFPGTEPIAYLNQLAWLHHTRLAPPELWPQAHPEYFVNMDHIPAAAVDRDKAWKAMPADLKGYLRLGAMIGHGGVINKERGVLSTSAWWSAPTPSRIDTTGDISGG